MLKELQLSSLIGRKVRIEEYNIYVGYHYHTHTITNVYDCGYIIMETKYPDSYQKDREWKGVYTLSHLELSKLLATNKLSSPGIWYTMINKKKNNNKTLNTLTL